MIAKIIDNLKTLLIALFIAIIIRSLLFQPFYIPSSSMEPTLLVGDRIFVSKYTYGYSKHSFPFSPPILNKRIFNSEPKYGDLIVFKTPSDNRTDFIKRLVGLPGDEIQIKNGWYRSRWSQRVSISNDCVYWFIFPMPGQNLAFARQWDGLSAPLEMTRRFVLEMQTSRLRETLPSAGKAFELGTTAKTLGRTHLPGTGVAKLGRKGKLLVR